VNLIEKPQTLAERIVNAVVADIYDRSGGDHWFDTIDDEVRNKELIPELVAAVERELDRWRSTWG
jgi:hypothetical protein